MSTVYTGRQGHSLWCILRVLWQYRSNMPRCIQKLGAIVSASVLDSCGEVGTDYCNPVSI
jgi:hypothetical protein